MLVCTSGNAHIFSRGTASGLACKCDVALNLLYDQANSDMAGQFTMYTFPKEKPVIAYINTTILNE